MRSGLREQLRGINKLLTEKWHLWKDRNQEVEKINAHECSRVNAWDIQSFYMDFYYRLRQLTVISLS